MAPWILFLSFYKFSNLSYVYIYNSNFYHSFFQRFRKKFYREGIFVSKQDTIKGKYLTCSSLFSLFYHHSWRKYCFRNNIQHEEVPLFGVWVISFFFFSFFFFELSGSSLKNILVNPLLYLSFLACLSGLLCISWFSSLHWFWFLMKIIVI